MKPFPQLVFPAVQCHSRLQCQSDSMDTADVQLVYVGDVIVYSPIFGQHIRHCSCVV